MAFLNQPQSTLLSEIFSGDSNFPIFHWILELSEKSILKVLLKYRQLIRLICHDVTQFTQFESCHDKALKNVNNTKQKEIVPYIVCYTCLDQSLVAEGQGTFYPFKWTFYHWTIVHDIYVSTLCKHFWNTASKLCYDITGLL